MPEVVGFADDDVEQVPESVVVRVPDHHVPDQVVGVVAVAVEEG